MPGVAEFLGSMCPWPERLGASLASRSPAQLLNESGLVKLQTTVLSPPAVVSLLADPELSADLSYRIALGRIHLGLSQLGDDLLHTKSLLAHRKPPY